MYATISVSKFLGAVLHFASAAAGGCPTPPRES